MFSTANIAPHVLSDHILCEHRKHAYNTECTWFNRMFKEVFRSKLEAVEPVQTTSISLLEFDDVRKMRSMTCTPSVFVDRSGNSKRAIYVPLSFFVLSDLDACGSQALTFNNMTRRSMTGIAV